MILDTFSYSRCNTLASKHVVSYECVWNLALQTFGDSLP